jgi:hypothetical protein
MPEATDRTDRPQRPDRERDELVSRIRDVGNQLQVLEANLAAHDQRVAKKGNLQCPTK